MSTPRRGVWLLVVGLAVTACTSPEPSSPIRTAPTHIDSTRVPASDQPTAGPEDPSPRAAGEDPTSGPAGLGAGQVTAAAPLPEPRTEVNGDLLGDRIVVLGGLRADGTASDRVDAYDPATDRWEPLPDLPEALHHMAVVSHHDRLWVIGGFTIEGSSWVRSKRTYSLGAGDHRWTEGQPLPEPRGALAAVSTGDAIWVFGGVDADGPSTATLRLRDAETGWERGPALRDGREHLTATVTGERVHVIAGRAGGLDTNHASVEVLDLTTGQLTPGPPLRTARGGIGAGTIGRIPCVAGGEEPPGTIGTVECLGPDGVWAEVTTLAEPRHGLAVVALDGALHVIGGGPEPGLTVSGAHEVVRFTG